VKKFVGGAGSPISVGGGYNLPADVFVTPNGDVFVSDTLNNEVKQFVGGVGNPISIGSGSLNNPTGLFVTSSGAVLVAD
jgi:hypothetical protein